MDDLPIKVLERPDDARSDRGGPRQPNPSPRFRERGDKLRLDDEWAELASSRSRPGLEGELSSPYEEGFAAYAAGAGFADNPYAGDRSAHLQWENGWSQARDEARRQRR